MLLAYSWLMRWKLRSAPERSACALMLGYFASKAAATAVTSCRSSEPYQTTDPSFRAAATSSGVTGVGSTASAGIAPSSSASATRNGMAGLIGMGVLPSPDRAGATAVVEPAAIGDRHDDDDLVGPWRVGDRYRHRVEMLE